LADTFAERTPRILSLGRAEEKDVQSLQNWLRGTGCIAREETAYLAQYNDLLSLAPVSDSAVVQVEAWVETELTRFCRGVRNVRNTFVTCYCIGLKLLVERFPERFNRYERLHLFWTSDQTHCKSGAVLDNHPYSPTTSCYL
jgi:hypothetical protein